MLSVCDIVLNHTANETPWLSVHPEATYNCTNCPHLRPAYLLDAALSMFSVQVARGEWTHRGVPPTVNSEDHLNVSTNMNLEPGASKLCKLLKCRENGKVGKSFVLSV